MWESTKRLDVGLFDSFTAHFTEWIEIAYRYLHIYYLINTFLLNQ